MTRRRKSSVERLDPQIREAVDSLIRDGRATIDEIVEQLRAMGGEVSRSAVGRYKQRAETQMARYREAQEIAQVWVHKFESDPKGDVARLLSEMLKTVAFQVAGQMGDSGDDTSPKDVAHLSMALKNIGHFEKQNLDRELKMRKEVTEEAADKAAAVATSRGLTSDAVETIRREILGIAA